MNQQDRKEFEIVHLKIDELKKDIVELKADMEKAHSPLLRLLTVSCVLLCFKQLYDLFLNN